MSGRLILVRHGQSFGNVERRLDTRPPGAELTDLGREQARNFARSRRNPPGLLLHSIARRAAQTATEISVEFSLAADEVEGIHEVQAGDLEDRSDDDAIAEFNAVYQRWCEGELGIPMPGGDSGRDVLDRYLPAVTDLRLRFLDDRDWTDDIVVVSHGAAIRLIAAVLAVTVRAMAAAGGAVGPLVIVAAGALALGRSGPVEPLADCKRADALRGGWVSAAGDRCVTAVMRPHAVMMRPGVLHLGRLVSERCTRPIATMTTGTTCGEVTASCGTGRRLLWGLRQLALWPLVVML
jgi:probable phosphoglycerate mutase